MNFGESYLDLKTYRRLLPILLYFCCGSGVAWCQGAIPRPYWSKATLAAGTEDTSYTINASDLLAGFSDVDGDRQF